MVDDLGWNDVDWRANTDIQTPYLNTLATGVNGVDLQHYYTAPTCGPSRAQFLSGKQFIFHTKLPDVYANKYVFLCE